MHPTKKVKNISAKSVRTVAVMFFLSIRLLRNFSCAQINFMVKLSSSPAIVLFKFFLPLFLLFEINDDETDIQINSTNVKRVLLRDSILLLPWGYSIRLRTTISKKLISLIRLAALQIFC